MKRLRNTRPAPILELPIHEPPKASSIQSGRNLNKKVLSAFLLLVLVGAGSYLTWKGQWIVTTGRVLMDQTQVTSPFSGKISDIFVQEGEVVKQGQLLAKLDDSEFLAQIQQSTAVLDQAQAREEFLGQTGIDPQARMDLVKSERDHQLALHRLEQAEAKVKSAELLLKEKELEKDRTQRLVLLKAKTHFQWEQAMQDWKKARSNYQASLANRAEKQVAVESSEQLLQEARQMVVYAHDLFKRDKTLLELDIKKAQADLTRAQSRLAQVDIRSPRDGVVSWIPRKVGEVVDHNDTMLAVMIPQSVWVEGYIEAGDVVDVHEDRKAWVKIDGLTDDYVDAKVSLVYPMERTRDNTILVGPSSVRSAGRIDELTHTVKILFDQAIPAGVSPEMVAWVWIERS